MAKYFGRIGYAETVETRQGIWEEVIQERQYYGDVIRNARRWENGESLNDNLVVSNSISIVADDYAYQHFAFIRYVEWMGVLWKPSSVEIQRPRIILQIGGVYNGNKA
jgi:hypothetical protein